MLERSLLLAARLHELGCSSHQRTSTSSVRNKWLRLCRKLQAIGMCSASVKSYIPSLSLRIGKLARLCRRIFSPPSESYICILYKTQESCFATYQVIMSPSQISTSADKCALPFWDPSGHIVFFDIQPAEPGTFTVPGVIDLDIYRPADIIETSWI